MKSYLFLKTLNKTSKHLIDNVNRRYEHLFLEGNTVYGWYEAIIELDTSREQLRGIVEDLKRSEPDILHIGIAVAKAPSWRRWFLAPKREDLSSTADNT